MSDPSLNTTRLHAWLDRMRGGDLGAREELVRSICGRLEHLARKTLRAFPSVHRWEETGDVLQYTLLRLLNSLEKVEPASMREFFGLAALQMRRVLLDLARRYARPGPLPGGHAGSGHADSEGGASPTVDAADPHADADALEQWTSFHEAIAALPAEEREVISLAFYHGLSRKDIAEILQVSEYRMRLLWQSACAQLSAALGGEFPAIS
jgi:RNA polymerase sigma-70 factor (ECF subfamily)